jgi:hypothetical protein
MSINKAFKINIFFSLLLLIFSEGVYGQIGRNLTLEGAFHLGTVVRHSPKITIQTNQAVAGAELSLLKQTDGKEEWQQLRHYPKTGITLCYLNMGEGAHGQGLALLPNVSVHVIKRKNWQTDFRIGGGVGYVSRPYNSFSNLNQNAIGSHLNGSMQARLGTQVRLNPHWQMQISACLTHFSNGSSALPNYGINIPTGQIALNYTKNASKSFILKENLTKKSKKHWGLQLNFGTASVEYVVLDGPRYPVWTSALATTLTLNKVNKLALGLDYEFNRSVYEWGLASTSFATAAIAQKSSTRIGTFISDEYQFGNASILLLLGIYQGKNINKYVLTPYYTKIGLRYYLPKIKVLYLQPYLGVYLKTHKAIAEYISFNVGFSF